MGTVCLQPLDGQNCLAVALSSAAGGDIAAVTGTPGLIIRVYKLFLVCTGASNITFKDGATALSGAMALAANGAITLDLDGQPWFSCSVGNTFNINSSASTQVSGTVYYTQQRF